MNQRNFSEPLYKLLSPVKCDGHFFLFSLPVFSVVALYLLVFGLVGDTYQRHVSLVFNFKGNKLCFFNFYDCFRGLLTNLIENFCSAKQKRSGERSKSMDVVEDVFHNFSANFNFYN